MNSFLTLTYSDEMLPPGGTLEPKHLQSFFKKLRQQIGESARLRFFAVGEYGSRTFRPHYHAALFGYPPCFGSSAKLAGKPCTCTSCIPVANCWTDSRPGERGQSRGFHTLGTLEPASAAYVAKYATKSMEEGDKDVKHPTGCVPPFSRQSLRPGIGAGVCDDIASSLLLAGRDRISDIPGYLSHGRIRRPIGRYLRDQIRERMGITKEEATRYAYELIEKEMQDLRFLALQAPKGQKAWAFRELLVSQTEVKRQQIVTKAKIKASKRSLT